MNQLPKHDDPQLRPLDGWRSRLAYLMHYPCYVVLIGAQVVRRRFSEWRGE